MPRLVIESTSSAEAGPLPIHTAFAEAPTTIPEASFRSTPLTSAPLHEYDRARAAEAELREKEATLAGNLFEIQRPYRENPEKLAALLVGSLAERVEARKPMLPIEAEIDKTEEKRKAVHAQGNDILREILQRRMRRV